MNKTDRVLPSGSSWFRRREAEKQAAILCDLSAVTGGVGADGRFPRGGEIKSCGLKVQSLAGGMLMGETSGRTV